MWPGMQLSLEHVHRAVQDHEHAALQVIKVTSLNRTDWYVSSALGWSLMRLRCDGGRCMFAGELIAGNDTSGLRWCLPAAVLGSWSPKEVCKTSTLTNAWYVLVSQYSTVRLTWSSLALSLQTCEHRALHIVRNTIDVEIKVFERINLQEQLKILDFVRNKSQLATG